MDVRAAAGQSEQASATLQPHDDQLVARLSGTWLLERTTPQFEALVAGTLPTDAAMPDAVCGIGFEVTALAAWDSSLLIFLRQAQRYCTTHGIVFDASGLPERITRLLTLASAVPERVMAPVPTPAPFVSRVGSAGLACWDSSVESVTFVGEVALAMWRLVSHQRRMQWRSFWVVVQSNASGALPIVTLIALLVGVIIAFLGVVVLERFGAGYYVSYLVGFGMLREMGALMTGIIIAGRTGAGFAAELGSMKVTEELDAYATLGISSVDHLVLPRVLGLVVMMPLLVVYADVVGIGGGMLVAITLLDLTPTQFVGGLLTAVSLPDALLGVVKGFVFGVIIGLSGCLHGLRTGSDASAVGRAATSAVVLGITLIVLGNAIIDWLAALWKI
jgi:phospholipid/cholesterol/gamma-HCH transport system permease protein